MYDEPGRMKWLLAEDKKTIEKGEKAYQEKPQPENTTSPYSKKVNNK